jgi:hypothetical protein
MLRVARCCGRRGAAGGAMLRVARCSGRRGAAGGAVRRAARCGGWRDAAGGAGRILQSMQSECIQSDYVSLFETYCEIDRVRQHRLQDLDRLASEILMSIPTDAAASGFVSLPERRPRPPARRAVSQYATAPADAAIAPAGAPDIPPALFAGAAPPVSLASAARRRPGASPTA